MTPVMCRVTTPRDAEIARVIRNSCRQFMTGSQAEIGVLEQQQWFAANKDSVTLQLFLLWSGVKNREERLDAYGYGVIRYRPGQWVVAGGLRPTCRGMGIGKVLFGELTSRIHVMGHPAYLDVFEDNLPQETLPAPGLRGDRHRDRRRDGRARDRHHAKGSAECLTCSPLESATAVARRHGG